MEDNKKEQTPVVLVCPLSWGLGHASRCIPVAYLFLQKECRVYVCGSEEVIALMKSELGEKACYMRFDGMKVRYGRQTFLNLLLQTPLFIFGSIKEHYNLKKIIRLTGANAVISDNRYGLWSKKVFTVFITHQLNTKLPSRFSFLQKPLRQTIKKIARKHNALWIPDNFFGVSFAGELSKVNDNYHPQIFYTGLLTRFLRYGFDDLAGAGGGAVNNYVLCIVSGPEPQRTFFEKKLIRQLQQVPYNSVLLRGVPGSNNKVEKGKTVIYDHTDSLHFARLIAGASLVICRPGYSTLMDMSEFCCKLLLVPTPCQPEQEYLARIFNNRGWSYSVNQDKMNLKQDIERALSYEGIPKMLESKNGLSEAINYMLGKVF